MRSLLGGVRGSAQVGCKRRDSDARVYRPVDDGRSLVEVRPVLIPVEDADDVPEAIELSDGDGGSVGRILQARSEKGTHDFRLETVGSHPLVQTLIKPLDRVLQPRHGHSRQIGVNGL